MSWRLLDRGGVRLACCDFGGDGPSVMLLHGLAGDAGEWDETAAAIRERGRVVAMDARGHGRSERLPPDISPAAHVADVAFAIEELGLASVVLVGQSLGGRTAMLVAAEHPDRVQALVVVEASPSADEDAVGGVAEALTRWRAPFSAPEIDVMVRTLREGVARAYWDEWNRINCPVLVVRGLEGELSAADAQAMTARLPGARLAEIASAGHDVHLDRPAAWCAALEEFLDSL